MVANKNFLNLPTEECTACMACVDICGHNSIKPIINQNGYFQIIGHKDKCIDCGICTNVCPVLNPRTLEKRYRHAYAVWNTNTSIRDISASGGAFSAIAEAVLKNGGVVYGAMIDGFQIRHTRVSELSELHHLLGSKYQHSNKQGIYKLVREDLKEGRLVLFSGMSCEIVGLKYFISERFQKNLYTIDTICGGHSTMLPMLYLKATGKYKCIHSFRNKEKGWHSTAFKYDLKMIRNDNGIEDLGLDNIVLNTFSSKLLKRSSCLDCKFSGIDRISDCTIGDFWGLKEFKDQHYNGVSVAIINDQRILPLINNSSLHKEPVDIESISKQNPYYKGKSHKLIRLFLSRKLALLYFRRREISKAMYLMKPNSWAGIIMRIYLKITK